MPLPKSIHPTFKVVVPSTNDILWLRPYLVKEQKILQTLSETEDIVEIAKNLKNLVESCIVTPENYNVNKLTIYDIQWLVIKLREVSVGNDIEQTYICKNKFNKQVCNNEIKVRFKLSDIQYVIPEPPKYENNIIYLNDTCGLRLFYPRIHDEMIDILANLNDTENVIKMIAKDIDYIFDENGTYTEFTYEEAVEFLSNLKIEEFQKIVEFYGDDNLPKLKIEVPYKCGKCGLESSITLTSLFDFFSF